MKPQFIKYCQNVISYGSHFFPKNLLTTIEVITKIDLSYYVFISNVFHIAPP